MKNVRIKLDAHGFGDVLVDGENAKGDVVAIDVHAAAGETTTLTLHRFVMDEWECDFDMADVVVHNHGALWPWLMGLAAYIKNSLNRPI